MTNESLSICIPTYNRVETLKITLPDLIEKVQEFKIKIFISDNNSTDETKDYVQYISKIYPYITYHKNNLNYGADKNMELALELSDTPYSLLLSDHYILYDNTSIKKILDIINLNEKFDCIILHYKNRMMFRNQNYLYTEKDLFLEELGWYIGMAATTIYSKEMIHKLDNNKFIGTNFNQSLMLLDYISKKDYLKIQYIAEDTIWNMKGGIKGSSSWHDSVLEIFTKKWFEGIMSLSENYSFQAKVNCIKNHLKMTPGFYSIKSIILYRYTNGMTFFKVCKYFKYFLFCSNPKTVILSLILSLIPNKFLRILFKQQFEYTRNILKDIDKYKSDLN